MSRSKFAQFLTGLVKEADAAVALTVAVIAGLFDVIPGIPNTTLTQIVNQATLVVLGLLAVNILRDRARRRPVEAEVREALHETADVLRALPGRLDRMAEFERLVGRTSQMIDDSSVVRVLARNEVTETLTEMRRDTDRWLFKGGTGTYIRAVTLPECVNNARRARRALLVRLEIIDPTDDEVCGTYARFRQSVAEDSSQDELWSIERTRNEAYATILAASWYRQRFQFLDIDVGLSARMTTFRYDMAASALIITREDPRSPAMLASRGKFFYEHIGTELQVSLDQARRVPIEQARSAPLGDSPSIEEVRKLFQVLGMGLPRTFADTDVIDITRRALQPRNPYT